MPPPHRQGRSTVSASKRPGLQQLEVFVKVAETRSFASAARMTGRTQPAISQAIARLEEIYGGDLFERRRGAPLLLTPIGEAILGSARMVLDTVDRQMTRAAAAAQSRVGNLRLGFFPGLAAGALRAGIAGFVSACPDVSLRMVEGPSGELYRQLNERSVDMMIVALMPTLANTLLARERLWDERLIVALPSNHGAARKSFLSWGDIADLPIMLRDSHLELVAYRELFDRLDRQISCEQHAVSCSTLLDMVGMGMGATIIPASGGSPHENVVFRPINEANAIVAVDAVWPKDDRNPLRHRLLSFLRQHRGDVDDRFSQATATTPDHD